MMFKKIFPVFLLAIVCAFATKALERNINTTIVHGSSSEVFAGIYAASVWNSNDAQWNKKANKWIGAGAMIGNACVKGALVGSGIGPVGTIVCVTAVGL